MVDITIAISRVITKGISWYQNRYLIYRNTYIIYQNRHIIWYQNRHIIWYHNSLIYVLLSLFVKSLDNYIMDSIIVGIDFGKIIKFLSLHSMLNSTNKILLTLIRNCWELALLPRQIASIRADPKYANVCHGKLLRTYKNQTCVRVSWNVFYAIKYLTNVKLFFFWPQNLKLTYKPRIL